MKNLILSLACLLLLCASAAAQVTSGRLTGVVTDQNGALVPGADVLAVHNDTRAEFRTTASGEGTWSIPSLPNGTYTIRARVMSCQAVRNMRFRRDAIYHLFVRDEDGGLLPCKFFHGG